ncbi:MAG: YdcF family protein [Polyangia bacterium]
MKRAFREVLLSVLLLGSGCGAPSEGSAPDPATCPVPTAQELYPGDAPPNPFRDFVAADACLSAEHDTILVLGCPAQDSGLPSACQEARANIAAALYRSGYAPRVITTGGAVKNRFVEADVLRDLLVARGIPAAQIRTEPRAEHTDENIYYSTEIMESEGWNDALVVSDSAAHLLYTALCDSNCCVKRGRLTVISVPLALGEDGVAPVAVGHYARYPFAAAVSDEECAHLEQPDKILCLNLPTRRACAGRVQLPL